jgi:hypothetical protein
VFSEVGVNKEARDHACFETFYYYHHETCRTVHNGQSSLLNPATLPQCTDHAWCKIWEIHVRWHGRRQSPCAGSRGLVSFYIADVMSVWV